MPTPSDQPRTSEFGVGSSPPRRSIFGNYRPETDDPPAAIQPAVQERSDPRDDLAGIEARLARSFIYRFLAKSYEDPEPSGWEWLTSESTKGALRSAVEFLSEAAAPEFRSSADRLAEHLVPASLEDFQSTYLTCFGHTVRGDCPVNEIEYRDMKADPLFQPHRLADLGGFYAAFGLEMTPEAAERQDHVSVELEFLSVLAAKEAYALAHEPGTESASICRTAQKQFLREHLGRWGPAFARRLAGMADQTALGALADFTREFVVADCARHAVKPGSEDLQLRPVDEASESLCASCGISNLPPGAANVPIEEVS